MEKKHKWLLGLEMLPHDVLVEIFVRLPSESVCRIRCVSKKLCKIVDCCLFAALHQSSATAAAAEVPRLLITIQSDFIRDYRQHEYPRNQENSNTLQSLKYDSDTSSLSSAGSGDVTKFFNLGDFHVACVFRNLFCFANRPMSPKEHMGNRGRQSCFLYNPLAADKGGGELLMLPQHSEPFHWYGMGMGFDHATKSSSKLKIIGIPIIGASYIYELGTGTTSWRQIRFARPPSTPTMGVSAFGNMYYWLVPTAGKLFRILSLDFNTEEFSFIPHPEFNRWLHLINLRGSLAAVNTCTAPPSKHIEIWVLTHPKKQWTLDYRIRKDGCLTGPHRGKLEHCGEWEHGLFFVQVHGQSPGATSTNAIFLDLRCGGSFKRVFFPDKFGDGRRLSEWAARLISFTGSMISLKHYGNLLQAREGEWHIDFENITTQVEAITACCG